VGSNNLVEVAAPLPDPFSAIGLLVLSDGSNAPAFSGDDVTPPQPSSGGNDSAGGWSGGGGGKAGGSHKKWGTGLVICTGFMVSEDTVLTAAHCLYRVSNKQRGAGSYRKVVGFYPSYSRAENGKGFAPLGYVESAWTEAAPEWVASANEGQYQWRKDIGVVRLARKVRDWFGLLVQRWGEGCLILGCLQCCACASLDQTYPSPSSQPNSSNPQPNHHDRSVKPPAGSAWPAAAQWRRRR